MGRTFVIASSQHLTVDSTPVTAAPLTMSCWFKTTSVAISDQTMVWVGDKDVDDNYFTLNVNTNEINGRARSTAASSAAFSAATLTTGTWFHAAVVFTSSTLRQAYLNGVAGTSTAVAVTPAGADRIAVGRLGRLSSGDFFGGILADPAIWNVALSVREILALATGARPSIIRPESLVFWPLLDGIASPEPDYTSGHRNLTVTGATAGAHPSVQPFLIPLAMAA